MIEQNTDMALFQKQNYNRLSQLIDKFDTDISGLFFKHITIVNDYSRVISK